MNAKPFMKSVSKKPLKSVYTFIKVKEIAEGLYKILCDLKISDETEWYKDFMVTEEYYSSGVGQRFIDVTKMEDEYFAVSDDQFDVDIFIGAKKVILIIRTKKDIQQKISKVVHTHFRMAGDTL